MDFFNLKEYTIEDIQYLIDFGIEESIHLDYKASGALDKSETKKKEISKDVTETLKARSIISVEGGGDKRNFHFVGFGCGFVWLEYDKRSKLGKEIEKAAKELHR